MAAGTPTLIPTPQRLQRLAGPPKHFAPGRACRVLVCDLGHPQVAHAVTLLHESLSQKTALWLRVLNYGDADGVAAGAGDIVLCGNGDPRARAMLPADLPPAPGERASEQGYVLHSAAESPLILYADQPVGLLYAVTTLLQLFQPAENDLHLPNLTIMDYPAFRWRGSNWSLFGEVGGWSQERGDGLAAFEKRFVRKLDLCLAHKVNLIIADGLGWNPARFPDYSSLMRRLNAAARRRGVHLLFTGYGSGYGCPSHDGPAFRNRTQYPDGPVYSCCGSPSRHAAESRTMGTCLSNPELLGLKQQNLVDFVSQVEPGAVYIHNLDASVLRESHGLWAMRCPECRRRWPDDALAAPDGMAGAYAWFYDRLADAINEVRSPQSGYEARRDCLLMMVSPNYSDYSDDDVAWRAYWDYYAVVGRMIRNRNIIIGLREQYCNDEAGEHRYGQLRRHLDREGLTLPFGTIAFTGGDGYYNNNPFIATPVLTGCFQGADMVLYANGNGYQEPQLLLNAEYCWNPTGSAFHRERLPTNRAEWWPRYLALGSGRARPAGLFAADGFLDAACQRLYGAAAGPLLAAICRLRGKASFRAVSQRFDRLPVLLPVWATLMPAGRFSTFRRLGVCWRQDADATTWARARLLRKACTEMARLNLEAARLALRAQRVCTAGDETRADIAWLGSTLRVGATFATLTAEYLRLMAAAQRALARPGARTRQRVLGDIAALRRSLGRLPARLNRLAPCKPLDYLGGDVGYRHELLALLLDELRRMEVTLTTGEWLPPTPSTWW